MKKTVNRQRNNQKKKRIKKRSGKPRVQQTRHSDWECFLDSLPEEQRQTISKMW